MVLSTVIYLYVLSTFIYLYVLCVRIDIYIYMYVYMYMYMYTHISSIELMLNYMQPVQNNRISPWHHHFSRKR